MQAFSLDSVDSTNEAAKRLVREGTIHEQAFVVAREQTAGKGSRGRSWASPRDAGIYLSVVDSPRQMHGPLSTAFTLAAGVACAEALADIAGVGVRLKPINDLYLNGGKLGGILTEVIVQNDKAQALITGVGINVSPAARPLPAGSTPAVCLHEHMPADRAAALDINALVAALIHRILSWNSLVWEGDVAAVERAWARHQLAEAAEAARQGGSA